MAAGWDQTKHKNIHLKLLGLFVFSIAVYVYIYNNITINTRSFAILWTETTNDINIWRKLVKQYIAKHQAKQIIIKNDETTFISTDRRQEWNRILNKFWKIPTANVSTNKTDDNAVDRLSINLVTTDKISTRSDAAPLLVLFTTFIDDTEKYVCRNNTLKNWKSFGALVKTVFFTANDKLAQRVREKGWDVLSPSKTRIGIPVLKFMFLDVMKRYPATFYAYANGDILFVDNLIDTLRFIKNWDFDQDQPMLIVGRRTNVKSVTKEQASTHENIVDVAKKNGMLFMPDAEDYFISNQNYPWSDIPEVVVGRIAYDNWLVLNAAERNHIIIDASNTILAVHQTTNSGNLEGHIHKDKYFNANLLRKLYKKIHFEHGKTNCIPIYTTYNTSIRLIEIKSRNGCKS